MNAGLRVLVLSCGSLGYEVAARLASTPGVREVALMIAPYRQPRRTTWGKVRFVWRTQGPMGFLDIARERLFGRRDEPAAPPRTPTPGVTVLSVEEFHSTEALERARAFAPDLGVVAGTYILKPAVFEIPRMGSINLHSGKVPEYRGAAPAFWELYNGETEVGITIHRVTAALDAGNVLSAESFPLDPSPSGDPMTYLDRYRREVLRSNGVRLMVETVARLAAGTAVERPQPTTNARSYRSPDRTAIRELRRRVSVRRRGPA